MSASRICVSKISALIGAQRENKGWRSHRINLVGAVVTELACGAIGDVVA